MSTVTARVPEETSRRLEALAKATRRSKSYLVAAALEDFLEEHAWQVARIEQGLAQADAGEFASEREVETAFARWGADVGREE